jgi:hypothetical protein
MLGCKKLHVQASETTRSRLASVMGFLIILLKTRFLRASGALRRRELDGTGSGRNFLGSMLHAIIILISGVWTTASPIETLRVIKGFRYVRPNIKTLA